MKTIILDHIITQDPIIQKKLCIRAKKCENCNKCNFAKFREHIVFGKGNIDSGIVLIGEAPGKSEDKEGIPFVGRAGQILDRGMEIAKLNLKNCFIMNSIFCRPTMDWDGKNQTPTTVDMMYCKKNFRRLLKLARPKLIILLGRTACRMLFDERSQVFPTEYKGAKVFHTWHPAATVYNGVWRAEFMEFWEKMRSEIRNYI